MAEGKYGLCVESQWEVNALECGRPWFLRTGLCKAQSGLILMIMEGIIMIKVEFGLIYLYLTNDVIKIEKLK